MFPRFFLNEIDFWRLIVSFVDVFKRDWSRSLLISPLPSPFFLSLSLVSRSGAPLSHQLHMVREVPPKGAESKKRGSGDNYTPAN